MHILDVGIRQDTHLRSRDHLIGLAVQTIAASSPTRSFGYDMQEADGLSCTFGYKGIRVTICFIGIADEDDGDTRDRAVASDRAQISATLLGSKGRRPIPSHAGNAARTRDRHG